MRLLFLTSRLPFPPNRGDRSRVFNFLKQLSTEHEITLVSFIGNEQERSHIASLSDYCSAVHVVQLKPWQSVLAVARNAWRKTPLQVLYYRSSAMERKVDELVASTSFDAVYVHLFRMAPYAARLRNVFRIVDLTDVISQEIEQSLPFRGPLSRALYSVERTRIERYERLVASECDEAWLISERDRRTLARACPDATLHMVPNGVDLEQFYPFSAPTQTCDLLFVGNMSVLHNVDAVLYLVREVLPLVQIELPKTHLNVVGADPEHRIIDLDNTRPEITVTGYVADLNSAMNGASVFIAPLRFAAGMQNKVIEAMAAGMAVVTTSIVNEGIEAVPGRDLLIADDAAALARQVVALCRDPGRRQQLGASARSFVQMHFRWSHVSDRMHAIEESL
jgi:sugar transferase (PEP-CTERM/EpsH1 system associated)